MFRYIIFAILAFNFVESRHRSRHSHHQKHHGSKNDIHDSEKVFYDTVSSLTKIDRRLQQFCSRHSAQGTGALFEAGGYSLLVPLPGFKTKHIDVVRRHRVVFIRAERREENDTFFSDVRILPEMVDFHKGVWDFKAEKLKIFFPYKTQDNEFCSERIDDKKIRIPFISTKHDYRDSTSVVEKDHQDNEKDNQDNVSAEKDHQDNVVSEKDHHVTGNEEDNRDDQGVEEFTVQFSDYM